MSNPDAPQTCAKCLEPVGSDAVFLKNGTYMCPACYQRFYGKKGEPGKSKNVFVSVEGVIAIVAVIGLFVLGYFIYNYVEKSRQEERRAAKEAEERAENLRKEEVAASEERARRAEESHRLDMDRQERLQKERIQAAAIADAKRAEEAKLKKAEADRSKVEEEKKLAELHEKQRREEYAERAKDNANAAKDLANANASAAKDAADALKSRSAELNSMVATLAEAQRTMAAATAAKPELQRKSVGFRSLLKAAQDAKASLLAQYRQEFPNDRLPQNISHWRNPPAPKTNLPGNGSATVDHREEYARLVGKFDAAAKDIQSNETNLKSADDELARADAAAADAKNKIEECNRRLLDMKATPAELALLGNNTVVPTVPAATDNAAAPTPPPVALKPGTKIIIKKDGTQVHAQSIMTLEDDVRYRDDDGKWQQMKKADIERFNDRLNPFATANAQIEKVNPRPPTLQASALRIDMKTIVKKDGGLINFTKPKEIRVQTE